MGKRNASSQQVLVGEVIPAVVPGPYRKAMPRLATVRGARRELAAAIMAWKRGEIDKDDLRAVAYGLRTLAEMVIGSDAEARLLVVESRSTKGGNDADACAIDSED